ncbi:hypothetical protein F52700_2368 [Fusarium sp. NRRL 52700]|nr:hypothetical protein F52700_2368 [Fusarium sp. NRRL 52700]
MSTGPQVSRLAPGKLTWSPKQVVPGAPVTTPQKPALCDFQGTAFLAWASKSDLTFFSAGPTFSFTHWDSSMSAWAPPQVVKLDNEDNSIYQSHTSALVVFQDILYVLVPFCSDKKSGLRVFSYTGKTFIPAGDWSSAWNTDVAAVVSNGTLHVVGRGLPALYTFSKPGVANITGPGDFSPNYPVLGTITTYDPALIVREGKVVLLTLSMTPPSFGILQVQELTLSNSGGEVIWTRTNQLYERGRSGVSAMITPDGQNAWICFKGLSSDTNQMAWYNAGKNCWSSSDSIGETDALKCLNEAALVWSDNWVYAVWNSELSGNPLCYSRVRLEQSYGTGYLHDQPLATDTVVDMSTMNMSAQQPAKYDLSNGGWIFNQGMLQSCTANAVAAAYRYELKRQRKDDFTPSRLYLCLAGHPPTDDMIQNTSTYIRESIKVLRNLGAVSECDWRYNYDLQSNNELVGKSNAAFPPQNDCFKTAAKHFTLRYSVTYKPKDGDVSSDGQNKKVQCWKGCIGMGYPVIFGFNCYQSWFAFSKKVQNGAQDNDCIAPVPTSSEIDNETLQGAHAVVAVGWDDTRGTGCFKVQNSYGQNWGVGGFFWMPYEWLTMKGSHDI